jgi:hypothetical protein
MRKTEIHNSTYFLLFSPSLTGEKEKISRVNSNLWPPLGLGQNENFHSSHILVPFTTDTITPQFSAPFRAGAKRKFTILQTHCFFFFFPSLKGEKEKISRVNSNLWLPLGLGQNENLYFLSLKLKINKFFIIRISS